MQRNRNIFIIGSEGFIGKACSAFFLKKGFEVYGADRKKIKSEYTYFLIKDHRDIYNAFKNNRFDYCINAAGSGNVSLSMEEPLTDFNANCIDVIHILEAIRNVNPTCKYLHISSAAVYGNPVKVPISETDLTHPLSSYGWHKLMSELLCKEYFEIYGLHTCCIRPFSVYGPRLRKQIFWDTFQKTLGSSHIEIYGTGEESRDYIYIEDLLFAMECIIKNSEFASCVYNIGNGHEVFIKDVIPFFLKIVNPELSSFFNNIGRRGDPLNWCADISEITKLGYKNKYSTEEGLSLTVEWLKNEHKLSVNRCNA